MLFTEAALLIWYKFCIIYLSIAAIRHHDPKQLTEERDYVGLGCPSWPGDMAASRVHKREQDAEQTHLPSQAEIREIKLEVEWSYELLKPASSNALSQNIPQIVPPTKDQVFKSLSLAGGHFVFKPPCCRYTHHSLGSMTTQHGEANVERKKSTL